jgi:hypothetical protein
MEVEQGISLDFDMFTSRVLEKSQRQVASDQPFRYFLSFPNECLQSITSDCSFLTIVFRRSVDRLRLLEINCGSRWTVRFNDLGRAVGFWFGVVASIAVRFRDVVSIARTVILLMCVC